MRAFLGLWTAAMLFTAGFGAAGTSPERLIRVIYADAFGAAQVLGGGHLSPLNGQRMRCAPYGHPDPRAYFRRRSAREPIRGSRGGQGMIRDVRRIRFERAYRERQRRPILKIFGSWGCSPSGGRPE